MNAEHAQAAVVAPLDHLVGLLCEDQLSDSQAAELRALLADEPGARRRFCEHMALQAALPTVCEQISRTRAPATPRTRWRSAYVFAGIAAAAVTLAALLVIVPSSGLWLDRNPERTPTAEASITATSQQATESSDKPPAWKEPAERVALDQSVAMLTRAPGARWAKDSASPLAGGYLTPGGYRLLGGKAQIEFYCGAVVVLEDRVDFEIVSSTRAVLRRGFLSAHVPPAAEGFTIGAARMDVVDMGTDFALKAAREDDCELHVLAGKVLVRDTGEAHGAALAGGANKSRIVQAGHAVRMHEGILTAVPWQKQASPVDTAALARDSDDRHKADYLRWKAMSKRLAADPSAILYFDFEDHEPWQRQLRSAVAEGSPRIDGAIVGCSWTEGRWPGKGALEFKRLGDRVRLEALGAFDALTYLAWIRVEGLPHWYTSLMQTDDWDPGAPHWHISKEGEVGLGVRHQETFRTTRAIFPSDLGRWLMIATVYDPEACQVTHYVDGREMSRFTFDVPMRLKLGPAEIGNWRVDDPEIRRTVSTYRSLNGLIDEFGLFGRAMSAAEIREIYTAGKPSD